MGLGALMVAGSAAPASAASHIDFSGYYRIMYMSETNTGHGRESQSFTDSYFQDRLNFDITFSPTDEISVYWRLRGPGSYQRWGRYNKNDKGLYTQYIYGEIKQDWGTILIGRMSDDLDCAGLCTFGYMPENIPVYTNVGPFDRGDIMDGIRYSYDWDNGFSILAQYVKLGNNDQDGGTIDGSKGYWDAAGNWVDTNPNGASDQDYNRIQVQVAYAWDGGGASLHGFYDRDAQGNGPATLGYGAQYNWVTVPGGHALRLNKVEQWGLNPAIMHTWGDFSVHFEGMATWGQAEYTYRNAAGKKGTADVDGQGYGAYLDFDYNYGPGNVTLASWWVSGSDVDEMYNRDGSFKANPESDSIADIVGGNFYPLLVAYNGYNSNPGNSNRYYGNAGRHVSAIGFANNAYENYVMGAHVVPFSLNGGIFLDWDDVTNSAIATADNFTSRVINGSRTRTLSFNNDTDANHWAIALTGNHAFTDDISMHYGLAYLALNKPNYRIATSSTYDTGVWTNPGYTTQDKDLGFEIDLGFSFQLLDNLKFTTAFGYMFNGDAYKEFKGYDLVNNGTSVNGGVNDGARIKGRWADADDSYVWFNSLTFAF